MIINNNRKKVLVLKAIDHPPLRLFPGHNRVDLDSLEPYTKGNKAAQAIEKKYLTVVPDSAANKVEANAAKEKNDKLNKANPATAKKVKKKEEKKEAPKDK